MVGYVFHGNVPWHHLFRPNKKDIGSHKRLDHIKHCQFMVRKRSKLTCTGESLTDSNGCNRWCLSITKLRANPFFVALIWLACRYRKWFRTGQNLQNYRQELIEKQTNAKIRVQNVLKYLNTWYLRYLARLKSLAG